jgi:hypothetical protein
MLVIVHCCVSAIHCNINWLVARDKSMGDSRKIGNVNEGIVEGGEDAGNAENELACVDG